MLINIYVNNNYNVETYIANIDIEKLKQIKNKIDFFHGKGDIKEYKGNRLINCENKHIEIISQKQVALEENYNNHLGYANLIPIYEFKFYEYQPHELSVICKYFIENEKKAHPLGISECIKSLLLFESKNNIEQQYFNQILKCITLKRYTADEIVKSDINLKDKISLLTKIKELFNKTKEIEEQHFLPKSYVVLIDEYIKYKEYLHSQEIYQTVEYSKKQKNDIKKTKIMSLADKVFLEKNNLI